MNTWPGSFKGRGRSVAADPNSHQCPLTDRRRHGGSPSVIRRQLRAVTTIGAIGARRVRTAESDSGAHRGSTRVRKRNTGGYTLTCSGPVIPNSHARVCPPLVLGCELRCNSAYMQWRIAATNGGAKRRGPASLEGGRLVLLGSRARVSTVAVRPRKPAHGAPCAGDVQGGPGCGPAGQEHRRRHARPPPPGWQTGAWRPRTARPTCT